MMPGVLPTFRVPNAFDQLQNRVFGQKTRVFSVSELAYLDTLGNGGGGGATEAYARRAPHYLPFTPTGDDDEFDDASFTGWTAVEDTSPVLTLTEQHDVLSILHPGNDIVAELHAWLKPRTISAGNYVETCFSVAGEDRTFPLIGLIMSDGTTYGAGAQVVFWYSLNQETYSLNSHSNFNAGGTSSSFGAFPAPGANIIMRLVYVGTNSFRGEVSTDRISWASVGGNIARTLTPAHMGFVVSSWSSAAQYNFTFRYVRFGSY